MCYFVFWSEINPRVHVTLFFFFSLHLSKIDICKLFDLFSIAVNLNRYRGTGVCYVWEISCVIFELEKFESSFSWRTRYTLLLRLIRKSFSILCQIFVFKSKLWDFIYFLRMSSEDSIYRCNQKTIVKIKIQFLRGPFSYSRTQKIELRVVYKNPWSLNVNLKLNSKSLCSIFFRFLIFYVHYISSPFLCAWVRTMKLQKNGEQVYDKCRRYAVDWNIILQDADIDSLVPNETWPLQDCDKGWEYNKTDVQSSIVIDVRMENILCFFLNFSLASS